MGACSLFVSGILTWDDAVSEKPAWDVFIWYGGLVRLGEALNEFGDDARYATYLVARSSHVLEFVVTEQQIAKGSDWSITAACFGNLGPEPLTFTLKLNFPNSS